MSIALDLERLVAYSDYERGKWQVWFAADPARLSAPFQNGERFPTIGSLVDHIFFIEARHLSRLEGSVLPETSGVAAGDPSALFDYAESVRIRLRAYISALDAQVGSASISFALKGAATAVTMTRRKLVVHILLHETRHLAQIAYAARLAGYEPPGQHDFFYCPET